MEHQNMPVITLPDGSQKQFEQAVNIFQIAESIAPSLKKATLAGEVDGKLVDAKTVLEQDATVRIVTAKDPEGLEVIRHSTAHLLAQAVKSLYPEAQVTIGPVIEGGFYYDFAYKRPFTPEDFAKIEAQMKKLAKKNFPVSREEMTREQAIEYFKSIGEDYKVELIEAIPEGEVLSVYQQDDFKDLCRGPHVPGTGALKAFKLTKLAGAYWRGDSNNEMLQRIYGTAWATKEDLADYLHRLEEAEKRDHRKIAKQLGLFHMQPEAAGMVFWHDKGWQLYLLVEKYIRDTLKQGGYQEIKTPQIASKVLWEKSGHWDKYSEEMFTTNSEDREFAIKPMSCPCHVQVFNQGLKSYKDLPIRFAEFGCCHRNEPSGALHGLMRVRAMNQDDGHIFCRPDQIQEEVVSFCQLLYPVYRDFGFDEIAVKIATRPENRIGSDEIWDKSEKALKDALDGEGIDWQELPGEGAFYGPKIEFHLKDCIGRTWQCGTMQVDFNMPERLGAEYVTENSEKAVPVMLHRAILGSLERFIGIVIENCEGRFDPWLAPVQAVVMNISEKQAEYGATVVENLKKQGFRVTSDLRNEKIGFKIRQHTLERVPYLIVLGDREVAEGTISVRTREGEDLGSMSLAEFTERLTEAVGKRSRTNTAK
jgi:threonyl-tRNA synthetase